MPRPLDPLFDAWVERARAVPIGALAERRGLVLRGRVERTGPCPDCGDGGKGRVSDRFSINTYKGVWLCRQCRPDGGDVIDLVRFLDRCDFVRACETLTGEAAPKGEGHGLGVAELAALAAERAERRTAAAAEQAKYREAERQRLYRWWRGALTPLGSPVEAYLALRNLRLPPDVLRYRPDAHLWADGKRGAAIVHTGPAMVAPIVGPEGRFAGLHTTWIDLADRDGKARVPDPETGELVPAKKTRGSAGCGRIELVRVAEPWHLVMGEGIETTLSMRDDLHDAGRDLAGVAFWTGISLGNIGGPAKQAVSHPTAVDRGGRPRRVPGPVPDGNGIPIPDSVTRITLLRDGDSDPFVTDCALERASLRWARPGRAIVAVDAPAGKDFNDLRREAS